MTEARVELRLASGGLVRLQMMEGGVGVTLEPDDAPQPEGGTVALLNAAEAHVLSAMLTVQAGRR